MFHQWNGRLSKSYLSTISTLVFLYTAVFLLQTHCCGGQSQMVGPSKPILAMLGEDIILPCHLQPATDVVNKTLEWARLDLKPRFVHVRRDGVELLLNQNPSYVGRTTLSTDKLKHGDMSLKLSKVRLTDGGTYKCLIPALGTSEVELVVGAISSHVVIIADIDKAINRLVLQCESKGWYPEPEVVWLDGEGNLLSAGPTEKVRGPDDLYTVSSRVTVEKRHSNNFICRVQQKKINQTRENEIQIRDDVFMAPSCSAVRIIVVLSVGILLFSAAFFVFWKLQQNKGNNKMHHDNKTEDGTGEREQLVRGSTEIEDLDEEKLKKKDEEEKDLIHVISVLMEQKTELEISRDKLISQRKELEEKRLKTEKKHQHSTVLHKKSNHSQKYKIEIDNMKTALQSTVDRLNKTEDVIKRITERKNEVKNQIEQIKKQLEETKRQRVDTQLQSQQIERKEETNENPDSCDQRVLVQEETLRTNTTTVDMFQDEQQSNWD